MIQDIGPRIFYNTFADKKAAPEDLFLAYDGDAVLVREEKEKLWYPSFADFEEKYPHLREQAIFLFAIDEINYFLVGEQELEVEGWIYVTTNRFRTEPKYWRSFAGAVGAQLSRWYERHRFCGRCGRPTELSKKERMLYCRNCGLEIYPTISPCVIVAVHDGDRLLLAKYTGREYKNYALIAGFVEVGETLEEAVRREVMEEVGLKVKNIKFYKSQPWPFSDSLLAGFFAELDGDDAITLQEDELSLGIWLHRDEIPPAESHISLTSEMQEAFRLRKVKL